jgi:uncharacterized protein with ParB-like and HNH nuclease domain/predicted transport protein
MHAEESNLLEFLKKSTQFTIPIFQRTYSWGEEEIKQLWDDIIRTGKNDKIKTHFIGSIVYILHEKADIVFQSAMVIDGQQRLTTLSLLLEALARFVGGNEPFDGFSAEKIREYYLINRLEKEDRKFKLLLTQTDKDTLINLVAQKKEPQDYSIRIKAAFEYFQNKITALNSDLQYLCNGLAKLEVVSISLLKEDNPQLIFESMNSTGKELSQADLIRNFVLMDLIPGRQKHLYEEYWRPMEFGFGQEAYELHFDAFMRHYLTFRTGQIPRIRDVYKAFKEYSADPDNPFIDTDNLLDDLSRLSTYYVSIALGKEKDKKLGQAFQDIRELNVDTSYPFLLELYEDYKNEMITKDDFLSILRLTEAYVFRRYVCNIPPNSLNKTFSRFTKTIDKRNYLESVTAEFKLLPSYRRFPTDEEFKREIQLRDLYNFRGRNYWLRKLENYNRKEIVAVGNYTIEHIMPQNQNLSVEWQRELGTNWQDVHNTKLHTLGNLTLTGYNSEYSDHLFHDKQTHEKGFAKSPLQLNEGLGQISIWNEQAIEQRADRLAKLASKVWDYPRLSDEVLNKYREQPKATSVYTLEDYPYLQNGKRSRKLFDALKKEILAIDPVVYEEMLKYYIAYKAETNFVDIVPLANSLSLMLNMPFEMLIDTNHVAQDVAEVGRWGNGEVEVKLTSLDEIPYVLSLINQSFEHQMGNGKLED